MPLHQDLLYLALRTVQYLVWEYALIREAHCQPRPCWLWSQIQWASSGCFLASWGSGPQMETWATGGLDRLSKQS